MDKKFYSCYLFFSSFYIERSIFLIYLTHILGLSYAFSISIQIALNVTMAIFEIPTGHLGDKYGHKRILFLGNILNSCYFIGLLLSLHLSHELVQKGTLFAAFVALGLGLTLESGNNMSYFLMMHENTTKKLSKFSRLQELGLLLSLLSPLFFSATSVNFWQKILLTSIVIKVISHFLLVLSPRNYPDTGHAKQHKFELKKIFVNGKMSANFFLFAMLGGISSIYHLTIQLLLFNIYNLKEKEIAIVYTALSLFSYLALSIFEKKKISRPILNLSKFIVASSMIALIVLSLSKDIAALVYASLVVLLYTSFIPLELLNERYINQQIRKENQALGLSLFSQLEALPMFVLALITSQFSYQKIGFIYISLLFIISLIIHLKIKYKK